MTHASEKVIEFFDNYAEALHVLDLEVLGSAYGDTFMFAGPAGVQAVKREDFLKVVPKRQAFFESVGLTSTTLQSLEETPLDDDYVLVDASWNMRFEKELELLGLDESSAATYILRRNDDSFQIVFQLDHQDLTRRVRELGLLPAT